MNAMEIAKCAWQVRAEMAGCTTDQKNGILLSLANILDARRNVILEANDIDVKNASNPG